MVLKKPYAFLIKHFRLIHILLTVLTIVAAVESYRIVSFFTEYINNNYSVTIIENMVGVYIGNIVYIVIVLIFLALIIIAALLKMKGKPIKTYLYSLIYYFILIIFISIAGVLISGLERAVWTTANARAYRDIALIVYYPQFIFVILLAIRAIGFDVKKFNFKDDLRELEITEADSEEIELNLNFDASKAKRNVRRFVRETGYYYQENKFILTVIAIIGILVIAFTIYRNYEKNIFRYNEGNVFNLNGLSLNIKKSMLTDVNTKGDKIKDDKIYLVLQIEVNNSSGRDVEFKYDFLELLYGNKSAQPDLSLNSYFTDYGTPLNSVRMMARRKKTYIIPYELDKSAVNSSFKIEVYMGNSTKKKSFVAKKAIIKLNPELLLSSSSYILGNAGNTISFDSSTIGNSSLKVENIEFTSKYTYTYNACIEEYCSKKTDYIVADPTYFNTQSLIVMDYKLELDKTAPFYEKINNISTFATSFFKVEYGNDKDHMKLVNVKYVTPYNLKDKLVLLTVGEVKTSKRVNLVVSIRNKRYSINLKDI